MPEVIFVTLNYDTLLDDRLDANSPIRNINDYVRNQSNWILVKLHGSVNWGRKVTSGDYDPFNPSITEKQVDQTVVLRNGVGLSDIRETTIRTQGVTDSYYPALAVPLGPDDELVCPPAHVDVVRQKLADADGLHLLVIGYSGMDRAVLSLIGEVADSVRSITVVDRTIDTANRITGRLMYEAWPIPDTQARSEAFNGSFDSFVRSQTGLDLYVERLNLG